MKMRDMTTKTKHVSSFGLSFRYECDASLIFVQFAADSRRYIGHAKLVEGIKWSPSEKNVFVSASSDGSVH